MADLTRRGFLGRLGLGAVAAPAIVKALGEQHPLPPVELLDSAVAAPEPCAVIEAVRETRNAQPTTMYLHGSYDFDPDPMRNIGARLAAANMRHQEKLLFDALLGPGA